MPGTWAGRGLEVWEGEGMGGWVTVAAGSAAEAMAEEGWAVGAREGWGMVAVGCKEGGSGGARQVDDNGMVDRGKSVQRCTAYKKLELLELLQLANTWGSGRKGWAVMVAVAAGATAERGWEDWVRVGLATGEVGCSNQTQRGWQLHCYRQRTTR